MCSSFRGIVLGLVVLSTLACSDADDAPADGGSSAYTLTILDPPGDELGLALGERRDLRVRYADPQGVPVAAQNVAFAIGTEPSAESGSQGATLSAPTAATDDSGIAQIAVTAGASAATFRVSAAAPQAKAAIFFVKASSGGFSALDVLLDREGFRPSSDVKLVQVRLYLARSCAELMDVGALPMSEYPERAIDTSNATTQYRVVLASMPHTLLAFGQDTDSNVLSRGCLDLAADVFRAGTTVNVSLPVVDLPLSLGAHDLRSEFLLSSLWSAVRTQAPAWRTAACPLGAGQLAVDAWVTALGPEHPTAIALADARTAPDAQGCRGALRASAATPDALAHAALTESNGPGSRVGAWAEGLAALVSALTLESRLSLDGPKSARHSLRAAGLHHAGMTFAVDLTASSRPVLEAYGVSVSPSEFTPSSVALGPHFFTLRLGDLVHDAFASLVLGDADVTASPETLGNAIVAGAASGSKLGCAAISESVCDGLGLATTCLELQCSAATALLNDGLAAAFRALTTTGVDLSLKGAFILTDADHDLVGDSVAAGLWSAECKLASDDWVGGSGSFVSAP